jgi:metal-responsive CopG/Arc/MetJ family transcriptional regulator
MTISVFIDDDLLREADETARLLGFSRSRLFALAVGDFVQRQRQETMLHRLNEVYARGAEPGEKRLLSKIKAKVRSTLKDRW